MYLKIVFFSLPIFKTLVKNTKKANRRGTLAEETYIFCLLGSSSSHETEISSVQRFSSFMEARTSLSPYLCHAKFEYSVINSTNSNGIFCFLTATCCLWAVLKVTAWLKWLQMETLLYNTDFLSHIKHLRWVCKTSKNNYFLWKFHEHMHYSYFWRRIGVLYLLLKDEM